MVTTTWTATISSSWPAQGQPSDTGRSGQPRQIVPTKLVSAPRPMSGIDMRPSGRLPRKYVSSGCAFASAR
jgi:hypothetical protein